MSSKSSFAFKNPMLNMLARWSGGKKLGVFFLWMLLIVPLYMLFEQTGGNVPAWVQVVVLGADVVLSMNYIVCALISALHDPLGSEDHLFSGIFFVITVCMAVIVGAQIIPNSSGSVLEPYHEMMSSTSEDGRYSVVFYGEKKNIFSGTDADVHTALCHYLFPVVTSQSKVCRHGLSCLKIISRTACTGTMSA